jgi:hypothetical protein
VKDAFSEKLSIKTGVVQGSILGSLLFNLFFNGIAQVKELNGQIFLYADDLVLVNVHEKNEDISLKVTKDMNYLIKFLRQQKLTMNASSKE